MSQTQRKAARDASHEEDLPEERARVASPERTGAILILASSVFMLAGADGAAALVGLVGGFYILYAIARVD